MTHVRAFAQCEPGEAALRHAVANESPATIPCEAMPGHVDFRKRLGRHRLDRVTPQSHDTADRPAAIKITHEHLRRGALTSEPASSVTDEDPLQRLSTAGGRTVTYDQINQ